MDKPDKKKLSERDICTKFITPALIHSGWDIQSQIREEVNITDGRVLVSGETVSRARPKRADYILSYKQNIPIAVIEAKDNTHIVGSGMQQALVYGEMMDIPFVFSSNGDGFLLHDRSGTYEPMEHELSLSEFPSPFNLWSRYRIWKGLDDTKERIITESYYSTDFRKTPRYYQLNAINRTVEAIANGRDRILLVMATGTGKTYTAFQIIWRLWKSGTKKRILFLADRNILVDQTKTNDFKPFGSAMTKITNRQVDKSYEIYLSLYQAVSGNDEEKNIYKQFSPDFFDLIVVDECHRGSAAEDAMWREILDYFTNATQIGLTATPKETKYASNIHYFGEPVYVYSLKQGIEDGFLAPYRVYRIDLDKDLQGWRPNRGQVDKYGTLIEDRIYNQKDFDRSLVLERRTELVARKVSEFLKNTGRYDKTIVFCENIDHAERMRQYLVNENADLVQENSRYIVRITGDSPEGKAELDNFILPDSRYPVIATTSRLMGTGVDAQTCKLIVIDKRIESMSEFKQIIGRGTRINEDYNKYFFTIMDFRKVSELFADPDFDGEPLENTEFDPVASPPSIKPVVPASSGGNRYVVNDVAVEVIAERVQYYGADGALITESLEDYTKKHVTRQYATLNSFLTSWTKAEQKTAILEELKEQGVLFDALQEQVGKDYDPFDLICHVVFGQPPLSRKERVEKVRKADYFTKYGGPARKVLDALLSKYSDGGIADIESMEVLRVDPFTAIGTPMEIVNTIFGGSANYISAIRQLEQCLYTAEC
ncbi:restriction endonuclease [Methanocalculus chunghsingensis]|uniref:Restriction endonuclease n=1 Tax=Methanocalculus chunghsingensis TaxID=156457 RepID=A0A8J8B442_9EURY|nr:DEAD/DEAH box helicase family protein [Methanocalculus chunghsingensis]MBR1368920.1 restriction endonuclease [Methanocalculus chunghsingensis]